MSWARFFRRRRWDEERARELEAYVETETDENIARGMSPQEARYAARRKLGNITRIREEIYHMNSLEWLETLWQDLRYATRMLARNRGFTAVAVITLALGIGATTAIFTVVNAVLLRPLPYSHPEELVCVKQNLGPVIGILSFLSSRDFVAWRNQNRTLSPIAAYTTSSANLTGGREAERVFSGAASSSFFPLLETHPVIGRAFLPDEDRPGGPPVVILSYALWRRDFGGDPSVVGKGVTLDGKTYTVVGVLPAQFVVPDLYSRMDYDLWTPLALSDAGSAQFRIVRVIGRLKPGVSLEQTRAELDAISKATLKRASQRSIVVSTWQDEIASKARLSLLLFLGAVGLLLLIACVNVANLLLSRATTRRKEMAVRLAVGAGRARIVRQLVTESTLLSLLGALVGLALAQWGKDLLVAFISPNIPTLQPIGLDYRVLGFSLALALVTGLAFGLTPAIQAARVALNETLKESSRSASDFRSRFASRNVLIVFETALAMVLLVGAGLLVKSFLLVRGIDVGFKSARTLTMTIAPTPSKYPTPHAQARFFQQVLERTQGVAGVEAVGGSSSPPLGGYSASISGQTLQGRQDQLPNTYYSMVSPDYFRTMSIPLILGRNFSDADREGSPSVVIVNDSFARRYLPGENCLGRRIESWIQKNDWLTIVGVVGDVRSRPDSEPEPEMFLPYLQAGADEMTLLVRTAGNPMHWATAVRNQVASVDKDQPPFELGTLDESQSVSLAPRRVNTLLLGAFALLGLLLASVGIYGVVSYSVAHRAHEIGIRMALGAGQPAVLKLVVRQGLSLALIGIVIGLAASLGLTRFLQSLLFGVKPIDPGTFVAAALLWTAIALLACYIPARRATRVDPIVALRYE
jgi:putative ABC transport system permease protein